MLRENYSLLRNNTFGIDVSARYFFEYETKEKLQNFLQSEVAKKNKLLPIGGGSNLLFLSDFEGVILHSQLKTIQIETENEDFVFVRVGSGVVWDDFVLHCVEKGWGGAENLSLIPGEVGASPVQNIGAYGVEAKDLIHSVEVVKIEDSSVCVLSNSDCRFGYRDSVFKHELKDKFVVVSVTFRLRKNPVFNLNYQFLKDEVEKTGECSLKVVRDTIIEIRNKKLPLPEVLGSAGSFFMNPVVEKKVAIELQKTYPTMPFYSLSEKNVKLSSAWFIDQCGWKGKRIGNVGVYEKQPLVLVNFGGSSGEDVACLAEKIQQSVFEKFKVKIKPEVIFV